MGSGYNARSPYTRCIMEVKLSPLMRKILADPKARKQLSEALGDGFGPFNSKQPIEFEGKTYFLKAANEINKNTTECQ